jgi:microcin C transport system substrate-binding protein
MKHLRLTLILPSLIALAVACGGGGNEQGTGPVSATDASAERTDPAGDALQYDLDIPMVHYELDLSLGDASVSAEMGGPGFTGEGWETLLDFQAMGSSEAIKGGSMIRYLPDWPATLRQHGKDWNSSLNYFVRDLCYESLLWLHQTTLEYIPALASHWKISEDKSIYTFRINPKARWSNGEEVTAQDVVASWKLRMDPKCLDPSSLATYGKLEEPKALSKYIVQVKCRVPNWRNFLYFASSMRIFPAAEVSIPGDEYLDKYQNAYTASSGPYIVKSESIKMGTSLELTRREDYWDTDNPAWVGLWNIGTFRFDVVMDSSLAFEKVKKGEIDYYLVPRAQWWAEDTEQLEAVERGLLVKCKYYTDAPSGTSGVAINTKRPPLDQLDMRRALQALYHRELYIDKLYFNEYLPLTSYFQGGDYQNQNNEAYTYDPFLAVELLEGMGWTEKNKEGTRIKDGLLLEFDLAYRSKFSESALTIFQEDAKDAGIKINLVFETPATLWKNVRTKQYQLASMAWGALVIPNPETSYGGHLADLVDNNNITSFKNDRVDELCKAYDEEYEVDRRREIVREIDGIIYAKMPYILAWYSPAQRMLYWNKFSQPPWGAMRTNDYDALPYTWWVDPAKEARLEECRADPTQTMDPGPRVNRFWKVWGAVN